MGCDRLSFVAHVMFERLLLINWLLEHQSEPGLILRIFINYAP